MSGPVVELGGPQDLEYIQKLLEQTVEAHLQGEGKDAPEDVRQALAALSGNVMTKIRQSVCIRGVDAPPKSPLSALKSPLLKPLSPPPVDDEVRALEAKVEEASQRVAALRASMQSKLQERIAEQLAAARPGGAAANKQRKAAVASDKALAAGAEAGGETAVAGAAEPAAAGEPGAEAQAEAPDDGGVSEEEQLPLPGSLSPQTTELQARLADATSKMPLLRARLEEACGRLHRVMGVAAGQLDGPAPNTVEKAVYLGKTPGPAPNQQAGNGSPRNVAPLPLAALAPDAPPVDH